MPDLVEQLRELSQLHQDGNLSDAEFEAAKMQLLSAAPSPPPGSSSPSLTALQNELAALDRQWIIERDKYGPGRYLSSSSGRSAGGMMAKVIAGFGVFWTLFALFIAAGATSAGAPPIFWIFPLFGVGFVMFGLNQGAELDRKAEAYKVAEAEYQSKRAQIEKRIQTQL